MPAAVLAAPDRPLRARGVSAPVLPASPELPPHDLMLPATPAKPLLSSCAACDQCGCRRGDGAPSLFPAGKTVVLVSSGDLAEPTTMTINSQAVLVAMRALYPTHGLELEDLVVASTTLALWEPVVAVTDPVQAEFVVLGRATPSTGLALAAGAVQQHGHGDAILDKEDTGPQTQPPSASASLSDLPALHAHPDTLDVEDTGDLDHPTATPFDDKHITMPAPFRGPTSAGQAPSRVLLGNLALSATVASVTGLVRAYDGFLSARMLKQSPRHPGLAASASFVSPASAAAFATAINRRKYAAAASPEVVDAPLSALSLMPIESRAAPDGTAAAANGPDLRLFALPSKDVLATEAAARADRDRARRGSDGAARSNGFGSGGGSSNNRDRQLYGGGGGSGRGRGRGRGNSQPQQEQPRGWMPKSARAPDPAE
ncbi:hypothetical protein BC828DRAFT_407915 [Blastocladiella britannica]|nr:hypothetical protein BC828DRAFT_407915 [Blastocladiella britannica]